MENTPAKSLPESIFRPEAQQQDQRTHSFHCKAAQKHGLLQIHNSVHITDTERLGHHKPLLQADPSAEKEHKQGRRGHKAQTANFDQAEDHRLTESAPLGPGIIEGQTGHTGGRSCRKQGRTEAAGDAAPGSRGKTQKQGAHQNDRREYQRNDPCRAHCFRPFFDPHAVKPGF